MPILEPGFALPMGIFALCRFSPTFDFVAELFQVKKVRGQKAAPFVPEGKPGATYDINRGEPHDRKRTYVRVIKWEHGAGG